MKVVSVKMIAAMWLLGSAVGLVWTAGTQAARGPSSADLTIGREIREDVVRNEAQGMSVAVERVRIKKGEWLWKILRQKGLLKGDLKATLGLVRKLNPEKQDLSKLKPGDILLIPIPGAQQFRPRAEERLLPPDQQTEESWLPAIGSSVEVVREVLRLMALKYHPRLRIPVYTSYGSPKVLVADYFLSLEGKDLLIDAGSLSAEDLEFLRQHHFAVLLVNSSRSSLGFLERLLAFLEIPHHWAAPGPGAPSEADASQSTFEGMVFERPGGGKVLATEMRITLAQASRMQARGYSVLPLGEPWQPAEGVAQAKAETLASSLRRIGRAAALP